MSASQRTSYIHVSRFESLLTPEEIRAELPASDRALETVLGGRQEIVEMLAGRDQRILLICGPCSIHDPAAALDYATRLAGLRQEVSSRIAVVMRVYFEKPRTTVGWKGLINDPHLDGSHDINTGLRRARQILLDINQLGLPCATEFLDPIVPPYASDLVSWAAIGARTTESQTHRQMASGLSMPVGFKNATDGDLQVALDAMESAQHPHAFVGLDLKGRTSIVRTTGNPHIHLVLRGGGGKSNYSKACIAHTKVLLENAKHRCSILVDCSHGNSDKDYRRQPDVFRDLLGQLEAGENALLGMMLESNIVEGNQKLSATLEYGKSITDGCIQWEETASLVREAYAQLGRRSSGGHAWK